MSLLLSFLFPSFYVLFVNLLGNCIYFTVMLNFCCILSVVACHVTDSSIC